MRRAEGGVRSVDGAASLRFPGVLRVLCVL